jgi:hypothetical protein
MAGDDGRWRNSGWVCVRSCSGVVPIGISAARRSERRGPTARRRTSIATGRRLRPARFPAARVIRNRVNAISLAPADDFRGDSNLFLEAARAQEAQSNVDRRVGLTGSIFKRCVHQEIDRGYGLVAGDEALTEIS